MRRTILAWLALACLWNSAAGAGLERPTLVGTLVDNRLVIAPELPAGVAYTMQVIQPPGGKTATIAIACCYQGQSYLWLYSLDIQSPTPPTPPVPPTPPQPDLAGAAKVAYDATLRVSDANRLADAAALAGTFEGVAARIRSGEILGAELIIHQTSTGIRAGLGPRAAAWKPALDRISAYLDAESAAKRLVTWSEYANTWSEIARGLRAASTGRGGCCR